MDSTMDFVMKQYADLKKDEDESSDSSDDSESEEEDEEEDDEEEEKAKAISIETQYINAMVAKIAAENEKNHPERNSKNVWEMLYGNMENFDVSSSDEDSKKKKRGTESSSEDDDDDDDDDDYNDDNDDKNSTDKKLTWQDIEEGGSGIEDEEEDELMDVMHTMHDFIMDTQERDRLAGLGKKKIKKKITIPKKRPAGKEEAGTATDTDTDTRTGTISAEEEKIGDATEETVEVEVEVEETDEEAEERLIRENSERIAKQLADARHEWLALHSWLVEFRLKHNMTILDFMEYSDADRDMMNSWQVKQLLSRTGHKFNPSESHSTWGGRTRKLLHTAKTAAESGEITHRKYIQLRLLHYRGAEYSPDDELHYTLRLGYTPPVEEEVTITSNMFDDLESVATVERTAEEKAEQLRQQLETSHMTEEDENMLQDKYNITHEDNVGMRSTFQYESGSDISDSDDSFGDSDSSSGDEFFWVGGPDGHNMRREHRKIVREDYNVLNAIFDTLEEKQFKLDEQARLEREAKEEAEKCPADVAGKIKWRLKKFEEAKAKQEADAEALRIETKLKKRAERRRRKEIRARNKQKLTKVMNVLKVLRSPDVLFR